MEPLPTATIVLTTLGRPPLLNVIRQLIGQFKNRLLFGRRATANSNAFQSVLENVKNFIASYRRLDVHTMHVKNIGKFIPTKRLRQR